MVPGKQVYIFHLCYLHREEEEKSPNPQIFYLVLQDPSRSLPRDHKFFPGCHHCSWTLVQHTGRVSFVPPQRRGHATNNLRHHFSCYMTLNILYLKKKIHTTWHKVIYPVEGQMLFNKRHSTSLCSASNLLNHFQPTSTSPAR